MCHYICCFLFILLLKGCLTSCYSIISVSLNVGHSVHSTRYPSLLRFQMLNHFFCRVDYLYISDTRTRGIYEMRKRDAGGSAVIRQGVTGIMNLMAYKSDRHSCKLKTSRARSSIESPNSTNAEAG